MSQPHAIIVGAGVGGLAAAVALRQVGWSVRVLERRAAANEVTGSGISLWPNALRALDALGLAEAVRSDAALSGRSGVRAPSGRWIARTDLAEAIQRRYALPLVITRRQNLITSLIDALGTDHIDHGARVDQVESSAGRARVRVGDQEQGADLVVVADGARSTLRTAVLDHDPGLRYAGYTSWRFITSRPNAPVEPAETWGRGGHRFAILPLGARDVYCYATANTEPGGHAGDERVELQNRFAGWHAPIPEILDRLGPDEVIRTDVVDLATPPRTLHRDRVVLLGDAAHAMTPDLGQGGCQALEDAVTLAALAPAGGDVRRALGAYSAARGPRGADLVLRSRRAGRLYQAPLWASRLAARAAGLLPPATTTRALASVLNWQPPPPTEHPAG